MASDSPSMLAAAQQLAAAGYPVFPVHGIVEGKCTCTKNCGSPGKHPASKTGFKAATRDPQQIDFDWKKRPLANIGIATGGAGRLLVVDCDPRNGGPETYAGLKALFPGLPDGGLLVRSGGGGLHYWLRYRGGPLPKELATGIDLKGDGGYVVAPPSLHVSGRRYEFEGEGPRDLESLPVWQSIPVVGAGKAKEERGTKAPSKASAEPEQLSPAAHERIYRHFMPDLSARPVAGKEYRGKCPIHGTAESGPNFSVNFETGKCRCLSRGCVEGYVYELVAAKQRLRLPADLPKVKKEVRKILGRAEAPKATPPRNVASVAGSSEGVGEQVDLRKNAAGTPRAIVSNVLQCLRGDPWLRGVVGWDEFAGRVLLRRNPPWFTKVPVGAEWSDALDVLLAEYLQREWGLMVGSALVAEAVQASALENAFHPVRDYLKALRWDGEPRIDGFLVDYFGVAPSEFVFQVGKKWLIGAVARIFQPGAKVDTMLILEGEQGIGKSSGLAALAGEWFADSLGDIRTKESAEQIQGKWVVEIAELDSLNRAEESAIKAFLSRTSDRFRPAYGRRAIDVPRQTVFAGTTNGDAYLKDPTGGRRFWPVRCGRVAVDRLRSERDQLWAEAVARHREGVTWWLNAEVESEAREVQAARRLEDPWEAEISDWLNRRVDRFPTCTEILYGCFDKHKSTCTRADEMRVSACMKRLGWERIRMRIDGELKRVFRKVEGDE